MPTETRATDEGEQNEEHSNRNHGTPVTCNGANPDGTVTVTARVNIGNEFSDRFVGRDSPQVATRIATGCPNNIPNRFHPGSVNHCGGVSQWSVATGGRMGQVMGEDAVEIAPEVRLHPWFFSGFVLP